MKLTESCLESRLLILVAGLAEQGEHILLVAFDAGLVEGIDAEQIAGDRACLLKEVDQITEVVFIHLIDGENDIGNAAVVVRQYGTLKRLAVDEFHRLAGQEVQTVHILGIGTELDLSLYTVKKYNGLKEIASAVLNVLTHRVQVGGEDDGSREDTLLILTLRLAVELLEPLVHQGERGLVRNEDLGSLALVVEHVADFLFLCYIESFE